MRRIAAAWTWLGSNKDALTVVFAAIAGCTALWQYLAAVEENRRKETLKYIERSQESRVGEARNKLAAATLSDAEKSAQFRKAWLEADKRPSDMGPLESFMTKNELNGPMIVVLEHHINMASCVASGVCSKRLALDAYCRDVKAFNNAFGGYIQASLVRRGGGELLAAQSAFLENCPEPKRAPPAARP